MNVLAAVSEMILKRLEDITFTLYSRYTCKSTNVMLVVYVMFRKTTSSVCISVREMLNETAGKESAAGRHVIDAEVFVALMDVIDGVPTLPVQ